VSAASEGASDHLAHVRVHGLEQQYPACPTTSPSHLALSCHVHFHMSPMPQISDPVPGMPACSRSRLRAAACQSLACMLHVGEPRANTKVEIQLSRSKLRQYGAQKWGGVAELQCSRNVWRAVCVLHTGTPVWIILMCGPACHC
jgi:hypothetical protein